MSKINILIIFLISLFISACTAPKPPTVSGTHRVPVNQSAEVIFK